MLDVELSKQASLFLNKADHTLTGKITEKVESLRIEPFPSGTMRVLDSSRKLFRVRVGDYRVLYEVFYDKHILRIERIDHRSRVYDRVT